MEFYISGSTNSGIKKDTNDDSFFVKRMKTSIGNVVFACVCDGMGGLEKGDLASATVVYSFDEWLHHELPMLTTRKIDEDVLAEQWQKIIEKDNEKIRAYGQEQSISLGTTLTALLLTEKRYYAVNVGDTRAYRIKGKKLNQITKDHSLVQHEIDNKRMTVEAAKTARIKNVLTQCIGVKEAVYPDFYFGKTTKDTTFFLCTDGFRHKLTDEEMVDNLSARNFTTEDDMKGKEELLIGYNMERRESDNITVVTVVCR